MKKIISLVLLAITLVSTETMAQGWLNRAADFYRQRARQQMIQRNNSQQKYRDRQRYGQQEHVNQQNRPTYQKESMQPQQRGSANSVDSKSDMDGRSDVNSITQSNGKEVSLVTNGTGNTKEDAIKNALRSAIEQAYGTFVSANTAVLNDFLIKDEIVTVSSGNIISYRELSVSQLSSGLYDVTVQAVVSIDQLTKFAQSKGMQVELAGASFMMNMKMRELNKKNEAAAMAHMIEKAEAIARNGLFDYRIEIGEPQLAANSNYAVRITILFCENENTRAFYNTIYDTFKALSLNETEIEEYQKANLACYSYNNQLKLTPDKFEVAYVLRNQYEGVTGNDQTWMMPLLMKYALDYEIKDNLGNIWNCKIENNYNKNNLLIWYCYLRTINSDNTIFDHKFYYTLSPSNRIAAVSRGHTLYEGGEELPVAIHDYGRYSGFRGKHLHFNPLLVDRTVGGSKEACLERIKSHIYYSQDFLIVYTPDELSKLNSITINHRQ